MRTLSVVMAGSLSIVAWLACGHACAQTAGAIWYRSAASCPDAAAFIARVQAHGVAAHVAQVGDAIDFVVTLGDGASAGASGVLERQTSTGTVALRRVDDSSCDVVADALALTLALSAGSNLAESTANAPPPGAPTPSQPIDDSSSGPVAATTVAPPRAPVRSRSEHASFAPDPSARAGARWLAGLQLGATTGLVGSASPVLRVFVDLARDSPRWFDPALRLAAFGSLGSSEQDGQDLRTTLWGGRLDISPVELELARGRFHLRPIAGIALGELRAKTSGVMSGSDRGLWSEALLGGRVGWVGVSWLELGVELAGTFPLTRYQITTSGRTLHAWRGGLDGSVGAAVRFP